MRCHDIVYIAIHKVYKNILTDEPLKEAATCGR